MECWVAKVLKQGSFKTTLDTLKRGIPIMDDDDLMRLFRFFWEKKSSAWNTMEKGKAVGFFDHLAVRYERRVSLLLDICWNEAVKRDLKIPLDS